MTAGLLRVWLEPQESVEGLPFQEWRKTAFSEIPEISAVDILTATDKVEGPNIYRYENAYHLDNIESIDDSLVSSLRSASEQFVKRSDWQVYERISYDKRADLGQRLTGTVFVTVGMSPIETPELISDYHDWYKKEHMPILAEVPGWRIGSRYKRVSCFGDDAEFAAPYLAIHQYDEQNGLGGEQWLKSVKSSWTKRILSNLSAPNHRRTWKLDYE